MNLKIWTDILVVRPIIRNLSNLCNEKIKIHSDITYKVSKSYILPKSDYVRLQYFIIKALKLSLDLT